MTILSSYTWNPRVNQYVDSRGRFVARSKVKAALDVVIDAAADDIDAIARRLQSGEIEIGEWYRETAARIKVINVASAALAVGGTHGLTPSVLGSTAARIKEQYKFLSQFAYELENGLPLDGTFLARARLYGNSGRPTYEAIARKADIAAGYAFERRTLGRAEHCRECVEQAAMGWQPAGVLLSIGECTCLNNCHCQFTRSRSEPAEFAMTTPATQFVERKGRVFKFGDHVDGKGQKFSLTREEFEAANPPGHKVPVGFDPIGKGHYDGKDNAFDGKLGTASNLAVNGDYLDAEFALNPILNAVIDEMNLRMSAVFGVAKKELRRIDVTDRPVIAEAAFFAEGDHPDEVSIVAESPFAAAIPPARAAAAVEGIGSPMAILAMQHIHDVVANWSPSLCMADATFAHNDGHRKQMALIHTMTKTHGAQCSARGNARFAEEGGPPVADSEKIEVTPPVDNTALFARLEALEDLNKKQAAQLKAERDRRIATESASFARDNAAVLPPTSQALFAGLYSALAEAPESSGVVEFSYGPEQAQAFKGSALDLLKQAVSKLKPHGMGLERTIDQGHENPLEKPTNVPNGVVLFAGDDAPATPASQPTQDGQKMTQARADHLKSFLGKDNEGAGPAAVFASPGSGQLSPRG